ncbi:NPP1 family protein [Nesterenkonia rhizosphaerae]|uniref:NPP1 family protein n=1 Tax=Nesterenkonia rhizosphaerae TaxID=1348272 RepID=UPI0031ED1FB1
MTRPQSTVPHDQIPVLEHLENGYGRAVAQRHQPYLSVLSGCVPYPAVDAQGRVSEGLPTDSPEEGCSQSSGQCYYRAVKRGDLWGIVYAWYFPKDCPAPGAGHRHDWEGAVIWARDDEGTTQLEHFGYSQHGRFFIVEADTHTAYHGHPLLAYSRYGERVTHSMWLHDQPGGLQPLIGWEELPAASRRALNVADFGAADVLIADRNFQRNLFKAWPGQPEEVMDLLG